MQAKLRGLIPHLKQAGFGFNRLQLALNAAGSHHAEWRGQTPSNGFGGTRRDGPEEIVLYRGSGESEITSGLKEGQLVLVDAGNLAIGSRIRPQAFVRNVKTAGKNSAH